MTSNSDEDEKALVVKRLTALAAMLSRNAPLPSDFPSVAPDPTPTQENRLHAQEMASVGIPEPVSRRMEKPVEVDERTGAVRVRGYRRKPKAGWLDWSVPINDRDE